MDCHRIEMEIKNWFLSRLFYPKRVFTTFKLFSDSKNPFQCHFWHAVNNLKTFSAFTCSFSFFQDKTGISISSLAEPLIGQYRRFFIVDKFKIVACFIVHVLPSISVHIRCPLIINWHLKKINLNYCAKSSYFYFWKESEA